MCASLANLHVLITRPLPQAQVLAACIRTQGGVPLVIPTQEIVPLHSKELRRRLRAAAQQHAIIYISRHAVRCADAIAPLLEFRPRLAFAPGPGTLATLRELGIGDAIAPAVGQDSEALLALPALHKVHGQHWCIVRGCGGREKLAQTLRKRGAIVDYIEVYRRQLPPACTTRLQHALAARVDVVLANSGQALQNLLQATAHSQRQQLLSRPLFVPSERVAKLAYAQGHRQVIVCGVADAQGVTACLLHWLHNQK